MGGQFSAYLIVTFLAYEIQYKNNLKKGPVIKNIGDSCIAFFPCEKSRDKESAKAISRITEDIFARVMEWRERVHATEDLLELRLKVVLTYLTGIYPLRHKEASTEECHAEGDIYDMVGRGIDFSFRLERFAGATHVVLNNMFLHGLREAVLGRARARRLAQTPLDSKKHESSQSVAKSEGQTESSSDPNNGQGPERDVEPHSDSCDCFHEYKGYKVIDCRRVMKGWNDPNGELFHILVNPEVLEKEVTLTPSIYDSGVFVELFNIYRALRKPESHASKKAEGFGSDVER